MKKKLLVLVKLLVTVLILWWVFEDKEKITKIGQAIQSAQPSYLLIALLMYFGMLALGICRWQLLLRVQGIYLSSFRAIWLVATGMFFNTFLPGATGGDVLKAWYVSQAAPDKKAHAILSIIVDRVIGLAGLILLAGVSVSLYAKVLFQTPQTKPIAIFVLCTIGGMIIALPLLIQRRRIANLALWKWIWEKLPAKELLKKLSQSIDLYQNHPWTVLAALGISITVHCIVVLAAWFVGKALRIEGVSLLEYYVYCPLINAFASIPATPGGVGLREKAFEFFFGLNGIPEARADALSILCYAGILTLGIVCGIIYAATKPEGTPRPKDPSAADSALK